MSQYHDLIVIGTGITGLSAAKQARQSGVSTAMIEAQFAGGLVININELDGEIQGSGSDLAAELMSEAFDLGADNISASVLAIERSGDALVVESDAGEHRARAIIIASGARLRRLGVPGEAELEGMGVSQCANCDGPFYMNQDVVVVGGGDSAVQEALVLAGYARTVYLVHRGAQFRAQRHLVDQLASHANIAIHFATQIEAVLGDDGVKGVKVRAVDGDSIREIACGGFFAYVGFEPACEFVPATVLRDANGFLVTDTTLHTAMPGVFAAGAVRSGYGGLLTQAVAEGHQGRRVGERGDPRIKVPQRNPSATGTIKVSWGQKVMRSTVAIIVAR